MKKVTKKSVLNKTSNLKPAFFNAMQSNDELTENGMPTHSTSGSAVLDMLGSGMSEPYKLYQGDNLEVMRGLPSESIDLIYIDPPYFSQRNYGDFRSEEHTSELQSQR